MVTIRLLGEAGRRFGRQFKLAVKTPAEAVRALCVQIPELRQYLVESEDNGIRWRVVTDHAEGLNEDQLLWPLSKRLVLAPIPVGKGAVGEIILGVALVVASVVIVFGTVGGGIPLAVAGLGMIFKGVAGLLTPTPTMPNAKEGGLTSGVSAEEQQRSFTFDKSNANTQQGGVVPVLYGERIIGSLPTLSFGLELQNHL
jgi:predicted phage tail protein